MFEFIVKFCLKFCIKLIFTDNLRAQH